MKEIVRTRVTRRRKVRPYQGRGPIYAWLRAHHASIEKLAPSRPCMWAELALDMSDDGVIDGSGDAPTAHNIRMTWPRVCRDVAVEAAAAKPKRVPPSRISPEWRPTVVPQKAVASPPMSMPLTAASLPSSPSSPEGPPPVDPRIDTTLPLEAQESLRKLFEQFDEVANSRLRF